MHSYVKETTRIPELWQNQSGRKRQRLCPLDNNNKLYLHEH